MFSTVSKPFLSTQNSFVPNRAVAYTLTKRFITENCSEAEKSKASSASNLRAGIDHIRDAKLNKGLGFSLAERQNLGIHGLLPPTFRTQEEQVQMCNVFYDRYSDNLNKYIYLTELQDRNEQLFYRMISEDVEKFMPIVYTPTVGLACQKFGVIYRRPRGLFITIHDKNHISSLLNNWPERKVRAICVTDGERILGLGDLGAFGMGIPVGKLSLYTALAGVKPQYCLPITLDVGTNNEELLKDPYYIGLRQKRVRGEQYTEFVDEFMEACVTRYGSATLIQFEDFGLPNAGPLLQRYRSKYCVFNDDIQGTASVALAGLIAATRITNRKLSENIIMFLGAGSAANGIANQICLAMAMDGVSMQQARDRVYMFDANGLLANNRPGGVPEHAKLYGKNIEPSEDFLESVARIKPSILIGCSTKGGAFTPQILQQMAKNTERPIVFALSNPTTQAECTSQQAYDNTGGKVVFASGSPFPPVEFEGKKYYPGQGNNAYIFPGLALGVMLTGTHHIPEEMFILAAHTLAHFVTQEDLNKGRIYPGLGHLKEVSLAIATACAKMTYEEGLASLYPEPKNLKEYILSKRYDHNYQCALPKTWSWNYTDVFSKRP